MKTSLKLLIESRYHLKRDWLLAADVPFKKVGWTQKDLDRADFLYKELLKVEQQIKEYNTSPSRIGWAY